MRSLLQSLRLRAHPELSRLIAMAWAVHLHRVRQEGYKAAGKGPSSEISRSSIFYASSLVSPRVRAIFEQAGLDFELWEQGLEVQDFGLPQPLPPKDDIEVENNYFTPALERYQASFPGRPVDVLAVVFGLLATAEGGLGAQRLIEAGMDLRQASRRIAEEIEPGRRLLSGTLLRPFELSEAAEAILHQAGSRATQLGPGVPLTTSLLLVALAEAGADPSEPGTAGFLRRKLDEAQPDRFDEIVRDYLAWYQSTTAPVPPEAQTAEMTYRVLWIFETARDLALSTGRKNRIHTRHLLGALLTAPPGEDQIETGAWTFLRRFGLDPEELAEGLLVFLREQLLPEAGDDLDAWELHLSPRRRRLPPARVPQIDSEVLVGRDLLSIQRDVEAFSTLIAANSFEPPLSIGLFGDWGSGKSFFMRRLRERVKELAAIAEDHRQCGKPPVSHRRIVQIEFNAWHYAEVNLWASLVTHIFEELHRFFSPQVGEDRKWSEALKRLDQATRLQAGAEEALKRAERELADARVVRNAQKLHLDKAVQAAWDVVLGKLAPQQQKELEKALGTEMLGHLKDELLLRRKEAARLQEQWRASILMRSLASGKPLGSFALVLVLTIALFGLVLWISQSPEVERLVARVAEIAAFVGGISAWLGSAFRKTSGVLSTLEEVGAAAEAQLDKTNLRAAEQAFASAQSELAQRQREVEEIQAELQELRPASGCRVSCKSGRRAATTASTSACRPWSAGTSRSSKS